MQYDAVEPMLDVGSPDFCPCCYSASTGKGLGSDKQALPALDALHFPEQPLPFPVPETNPTVLASVPILAQKSVLPALEVQHQALVQPQ